MAKSNENEAAERMARVTAAVKAASVPDFVISRMQGLMPTGQWSVDTGGPKPSRELLVIAGLCTKQSAGCEGGFHALQMREGGATLRDLSYAFKAGPAHNHSRAIAQGTSTVAGLGYFWREQIGPGTWRMVLTAKGEKYIMSKLAGITASAAAVSEKPAKALTKAKGKAKPSKAAKQPVTETPPSEAPNVTEGQPVVVDEATNQQPVNEPFADAGDLQPVTVDTPNVGGVDAEHDAITNADIQALAAHFNQG